MHRTCLLSLTAIRSEDKYGTPPSIQMLYKAYDGISFTLNCHSLSLCKHSGSQSETKVVTLQQQGQFSSRSKAATAVLIGTHVWSQFEDGNLSDTSQLHVLEEKLWPNVERQSNMMQKVELTKNSLKKKQDFTVTSFFDSRINSRTSS